MRLSSRPPSPPAERGDHRDSSCGMRVVPVNAVRLAPSKSSMPYSGRGTGTRTGPFSESRWMNGAGESKYIIGSTRSEPGASSKTK